MKGTTLNSSSINSRRINRLDAIPDEILLHIILYVGTPYPQLFLHRRIHQISRRFYRLLFGSDPLSDEATTPTSTALQLQQPKSDDQHDDHHDDAQGGSQGSNSLTPLVRLLWENLEISVHSRRESTTRATRFLFRFLPRIGSAVQSITLSWWEQPLSRELATSIISNCAANLMRFEFTGRSFVQHHSNKNKQQQFDPYAHWRDPPSYGIGVILASSIQLESVVLRHVKLAREYDDLRTPNDEFYDIAAAGSKDNNKESKRSASSSLSSSSSALRVLEISGCPNFTSTLLQQIVRRHSGITDLILDGVDLDDDAIRIISTLRWLQHLHLSPPSSRRSDKIFPLNNYNDNDDDNGNYHYRYQSRSSISDPAMRFLARESGACNRLQKLVLRNCPDISMQSIRELLAACACTLREFALSDCERAFSRPSSHSFFLVNNDDDDDGGDEEGGDYDETEAARRRKRRRLSLPQLERVELRIDLQAEGAGDDFLNEFFLARMPALKVLDLSGSCGVTGEGFQSFVDHHDHHHEALESLNLEDVRIDDEWLSAVFAACPNLRSVYLGQRGANIEAHHFESITDAAIEDLCYYCPKLELLSISACTAIGPASLVALAQPSSSIETLILENVPNFLRGLHQIDIPPSPAAAAATAEDQQGEGGSSGGATPSSSSSSSHCWSSLRHIDIHNEHWILPANQSTPQPPPP